MAEEAKKDALTPEELKKQEETAKAEAEAKAKSEAEVKEKAEAEEKAQAEKKPTIGEILKTAPKEEKKESRMVPEAVLLEYKNQNKELKKDIKELKELIESGASKKEVSEDLEAIAEEHGVDVEFLQKLANSIRKEVEADVESRIKPFAEKEKMAEFNKRFDEVYDKTLEEMPEYKDIISKDAIKSLSLDPKNANKTFAQILEMTYGNLIKGKKTIESGGAGKNIVITEIDFERAKKEPAYFHEIMKNPELKKKYNAGLTSRINL